MRVAVMGRSVRPGATGVGRYATNLIASLSRILPPDDLVLFLTRDAPRRWTGAVREVHAPFPTPSEFARAVWEQAVVPVQARNLGVEVYHSPNYILPAALTCPAVVTVHDLAFLRPELHRLRSHLYLTALTGLALQRAAAVVAVSEHTRREVEAHYPHTAGRVEVIKEAVDPALRPPTPAEVARFRERLGLSFPYVLFVGTKEPRKNLVRLVEAFEFAVARSGLPHHLMLVGPRGWKTSMLDAVVELSPLRERIHQVGYVPDEDLACWYGGADLFVYPSLDEGFGLPPLEAMACGAPVLTSDRASLPEVVGDAGVLIDPQNTAALAAGIVRVLTDAALAGRLRAAGREQAARFSWEEVARRHAALYERVASGAGGPPNGRPTPPARGDWPVVLRGAAGNVAPPAGEALPRRANGTHRPQRLKVAAYHPWVYLKGGAERTLLELMRRSRHEWTLYTNHYDPEGTFPEFRDQRVVELGRVSVRRTLLDVGLASLRALTQRLPLHGAAALLVSSEGLGNLVTLGVEGVPVFCFCHTPLKVVYDPFTRERYFSQGPSPLMRAGLALYTAVDRLGWRRYERVFCNSREVAGRVLNAGLAPSWRVEVLYPGVDLHRFDGDGPRERFFLLAGRIARTKSIEIGIDAFLRLKAECPEAEGFRLVIAGMVDDKSRPYLRAMQERAGGRADVQFVLGPSDADLRDLYRRCYATLFAALNEDWGLVVLEAMASGKPVIAVGRGGPCESVLDGVTGFLCPADAGAFAQAMRRLVADPARAAAMGEAGRARAESFPWAAFVERIDAYVESLAGLPAAAPDVSPVPAWGG